MKKIRLPIKNWEAQSQEEFWKKFKKKQAHKFQFAIEIAGKLFVNNQQEVAIELLNFLVEDYQQNKNEVLSKSKYPSLYKSNIIKLCLKIAGYYNQLNKFSEAEKYYFKGASIYLAKEQEVDIEFKTEYDGYLPLARLYIENGELLKAEEILLKLEKSNKRVSYYGVFMSLHKELAILKNNFIDSDRIHRKRIKPSYEELESIPYINIKNEISNNLAAAAEAIIIYHHVVSKEIKLKKKESLKKLDYLLRNKIDSIDGSYNINSYKIEFLNDRLIPELGAYIGEVLINEFEGSWKKGENLMQSRILIKGKSFNPFDYAYKVVYFGHRLIEEVYNKVNKEM